MTAHPMRVAYASEQVRSARRKLLRSCAAAAILVTAGTTAQKAKAQAFQGTPSLPNPNIAASGSASRNITSPTTETITVGTPNATINWTPTDNDGSGTIDFLPAGNVATFINDPSLADFTVLNRILPSQTRPIALNGTVISQLQSASGTTTGGHVWFYSPNGIIVGASAVFDVGGLLLTVNDPVSFNQTANGFTGHFQAATDSTATVTIDPGAKINASPENSYVALVAPRVEQGGDISVNGSAAYVAGEDVTLTMNQGLFDIQVDVGTSDPYNPDSGNGIVHTGSTGGPASTGPGDNQKIYMVAVPKNQALTMLLAGNAGFTPAGAAQVVNGEIVLSAGWNIYDTSGARSVSTPSFADASIKIAPGTYSSNVFGIARGDISAIADTADMTFLGSVNFNTYDAANTGNVTLGAQADNTLRVDGSVLMNSSNPANVSLAKLYADDFGRVNIEGDVTMVAQASPGNGGDATISADNDGEIDIGGTAYVAVSGTYFSAADAGLEQFAQSAFGGSINVTAFNGGLINAGGMNLTADGTGQDSIGGDAGTGYGGYIQVDAETGGDIEVAGSLNASARGFGGNIFNGLFGSGTYAGYGSGGSIYLSVGDGTIGVTGNVSLDSSAVGGTIGDGGSGASQYGGTGSGGYAYLYADGPGSITVGGSTNLIAEGFGGKGQTGGSGYGGNAGVYAYDGTIDLGANIGIDASGWGGDASFGFGGMGGYGSGGNAYIEALANLGNTDFPPTFGTITADTDGYVFINASGTGGAGGAGNGDNIAAGQGGEGDGGFQCGDCESYGGAFALAQVDGASLTLGRVDLYALGVGGAGGTGGAGQAGGAGGNGYGGLTQAGLLDDQFNPTGATTGTATFGDIRLDSTGYGGGGGASLLERGDGGWGFGGDAMFMSFGSDANASSLELHAGGNGGTGGLVGGDAYGGTITISTDGGHIDVTNALTALTDSFAGAADTTGTGGAGYGGDITLTVNGGSITFNGGQLASRGNGATGLTAGDGFGGTVDLSITDLGGLLAMNGDVLIAAFGGGDFGIDVAGGTGGTGGAGYGGDINISTSSNLVPEATAALQFGNLTLRALGVGGDGGAGLNGGAGAYGEGGTVTLLLGTGGTIDGSTLVLQTTGQGGSGGGGTAGQGDGGAGQGGTSDATIDGIAILGGSVENFNGLVVTTFGQGGDGLTGGSATGGTSSILVNGTLHVTGLVQSTASGLGGNGATNGGDGFGNSATITVNGDLTAGSLLIRTNGLGGDGSVAGGFAQGGSSVFELPAGLGTATIISMAHVESNATGGNSSTGDGGGATAGDAHVEAHDGTHISVNNLTLTANALGGNGVNGGYGEGGFVEAIALQQDALLTLTGSAVISASGNGGSGTIAGTGGDGSGGKAGLYAGINDDGQSPLIGGTVTAEDVDLTAIGTGGTGGLGGAGGGGLVQVGSRYGSLTVTGNLYGDAGGTGGNSLAGAGATGEGGTLLAAANFAGDTGDSTTNLGHADLYAIGVGGNGGGSGNAGGTGYGGLVEIISPTAGSTLTAAALSLHAGANGGLGGNGAVGGRGGDAYGGQAQIDISGGSADLGVVNSLARGVAGNGGAGSTGVGGAGGDGFGGLVNLNVTGSLTGTSYQGDAAANGGTGGTGTTQGAGGSAQGGGSYFNVYVGGDAALTGAVFLNASGVRGTGSSVGGSSGGLAELLVSDTFSSGAFTAAANGADAGSILITVSDGSIADLGNAQLFALGLPGTGSISIHLGGAPVAGGGGGLVALGLGNTLLTADSLALNTSGNIDISSLGGASIDVAGHFQATAGGPMTLDDVDDTAVVRADFIDFDANSFSSSFDILGRVIGIHTVLDLDVTPTVLIADETLTLSSNANVIAGNLNAGLAINLNAGGSITTGDLDSGGDIEADANGNITLGNVVATGRVGLDSDANILFGHVNADVLDFSATGSVTGGDVVAVTKATGDAGGAIHLGNITVGPGNPGTDFSVGIASETSITVGNVSGVGGVGFATLGTLTTGNIVAGPTFLVLASGDVHTGSITTAATGRVYMADSSMFATGGGGCDTCDFDPSIVLALAPVPTVGSITIGGPVSTGSLQAAAGTDLHTGNVTTTFGIDVSAGRDILMGALNSGDTINADAGRDLTTGNITAGGRAVLTAARNVAFSDVHSDSFKFVAGGTANGGNIFANTRMAGTADGAITLGNIIVGPALPPAGKFSVALGSLGSITLGNVQAADQVGLVAAGGLTAGNIQAGSLLMTMVHGDVHLGSVTTAADGRVYMGDSSMLATGGGTLTGDAIDAQGFDPAVVLALAPVATGGSITITGPVSTGRFQANAGVDLHTANVTAATSIEGNAGHDILGGTLTAGTTVGETAGHVISVGDVGFGQSVSLNAGDTIVAGNLTGGHNVTMTAGNNLVVGSVHADGTAIFNAVGLATFRGTVAVPTITVTSSDIDVPVGGALGVHGITNLLTLNAVSGNPIIIGSTGAAGPAAAATQYVLNEDGDIAGDTIVINAVGANGGPDPDIIVHNVNIDGSASPEPAVSHVVLNTDASVLVDGLVLFTGAGATDSLAINAGHSIEVNTSTGGRIAMVTPAEDGPSGLLTLTSDNIWVGTQSLLDQLNGDVNFAGRDALIGTNSGAVVPEGYLIAGGMTLSVGGSLFVQNSGAAQNYAGITVGAGGLKVTTTGTTPAQVVAYGRKMNTDGSFVTGNQFFALVDFTKSTSHYTPLSEFNECLINSGCFAAGGAGGGTLGPESILGPVDLMGNPQETIEWASTEDLGGGGGTSGDYDTYGGGEDGSVDGGAGGDEAGGGGRGGVSIGNQLFGTSGLSDDALVDEGVTSGGDNNQWDSQLCKPTVAGQPCPEDSPPTDKQEH